MHCFKSRVRSRILATPFGICLLLIGLSWASDCELLADSLQPASQPTIARSTFAPVPLKAPQQPGNTSGLVPASPAKTSTTTLVTVGSSLAIVLGLFAALVWVSRKTSKHTLGNREIPDDALCILGKKSLGAQGSIALVRCGRSILILGIHASGMQRLGEVTDDDDVRRIEAICNGESKARFDETLAELQREPIRRGFTGDGVQQVSPSPRQKLFASS